MTLVFIPCGRHLGRVIENQIDALLPVKYPEVIQYWLVD